MGQNSLYINFTYFKGRYVSWNESSQKEPLPNYLCLTATILFLPFFNVTTALGMEVLTNTIDDTNKKEQHVPVFMRFTPKSISDI